MEERHGAVGHDKAGESLAAPPEQARLSRRGFLTAAGGVVAGGMVAGATEHALSAAAPVSAGQRSAAEPFYGARQGGITTAAQTASCFAAFDVTTKDRRRLASLLRTWTTVAAELAAGRPAAGRASSGALETDSGEALGLGPRRLTVNFGFGPSLFASGRSDRFGLGKSRPMALVEMPSFPGDRLVDQGGDLTVHACADDPQVAFHAVRQLTRAADGVARLVWSQAGFNEAAVSPGTPRNLTGFKDGTINPTTDKELEDFVLVGDEGPSWMEGGTYVVVRRIRIQLERWDRKTLRAQEDAIGRHKVSGAPLGRELESDPLDLHAVDPAGRLVIPADSHVRLASQLRNWGQMLLRRSYSYDNGATGPASGPSRLDAGLFFVCYQRNARLGFIPMYDQLSRHDALRHFSVHTASALSAIPPAAEGPGHYVGEQLLES